MRALLKLCILPPGGLFVLALLGLALRRRRPRLGRGLVVAAALLGYAASTPLCAALLIKSLETEPPLAPDGGPARSVQAIVVLGGDHHAATFEFGPDGEIVGELSLERLRYGAYLQRATGKPLLVTGGRLRHGRRPIAERMRSVLEDEFGVPVRWVEDRSRTTWENARASRDLLAAEGIDRIALVTHAWHMPRAVASFRIVGFDVVPAPTIFRAGLRFELAQLLPAAGALGETALALHEWLGRAWYRLRYF